MQSPRMRWAQKLNSSKNWSSFSKERCQKSIKKLYKKKKSSLRSKHLSATKASGKNTKIGHSRANISGDRSSSRKMEFCKTIMMMNLNWPPIWTREAIRQIINMTRPLIRGKQHQWCSKVLSQWLLRNLLQKRLFNSQCGMTRRSHRKPINNLITKWLRCGSHLLGTTSF